MGIRETGTPRSGNGVAGGDDAPESRTPRPAPPSNGDGALLRVRRLKRFFPVRSRSARRTGAQVRAVDGVGFNLREGETLALVGESGSGKTTTARCVVRADIPTEGEVLLRTDRGDVVDLAPLSRKELRPFRAQLQMIFQDPRSSLNPRLTVRDIVGEPLLVNGVRSSEERSDRVEEMLRLVGLPVQFMNRYPHAFSGGQRQRIGIARALALNPRLVVADEPVSALDVSVQAQILNLLLDLQERLGLTYLFVSHDLSVVKVISDRVAVMYVGQIVELADTETLYAAPRHPYTSALLASIPIPDPRLRNRREALPGEVANPADPPSGCYFHPRCRYATDRCRTEAPEWREIAPGHLVRCHLAEELSLAGAGDL
jgi:peptide/nickel transport system ATP-binding protein